MLDIVFPREYNIIVDKRYRQEDKKWRKKVEKIKEKEIRLNIRISEKLREEFRTACTKQCVNGSELVRRFIEEWTAKNK